MYCKTFSQECGQKGGIRNEKTLSLKIPRKSWQSLRFFYSRQFWGTFCPWLMEQEESFSRQFLSLEQNVFFSVSSFYSGICFRSNKIIAPRFRNENIKKASIYSDIDKMLILKFESSIPHLCNIRILWHYR